MELVDGATIGKGVLSPRTRHQSSYVALNIFLCCRRFVVAAVVLVVVVQSSSWVAVEALIRSQLSFSASSMHGRAETWNGRKGSIPAPEIRSVNPRCFVMLVSSMTLTVLLRAETLAVRLLSRDGTRDSRLWSFLLR